MHLVAQCSNCGGNVRPEHGVATATTVQHRACAQRFGVGSGGRVPALPPRRTLTQRPRAASSNSATA